MYSLLAIFLQFLSGSIMYSYLLARLLNVDLRKVGDGNPGSLNLWRAKGMKFGMMALILDYFKGTFPLFLFIIIDTVKDEYVIAVAALFGILGHAFSPMLKFKGGKAVATTFGAWSVLTKWEAPTILGITFTIFAFLKSKRIIVKDDSFGVLLGFIALLPYVIYKLYSGQAYILLFYIGNLCIIGYKYWHDWVKFFKIIYK
jgi:glycerol-3-phosphate acyltransferase PlsY